MTAVASLLTAFVFLFLLPQDTQASPRQDAAQVVTAADDLIITAAYDGPLSGGTPKGVELYVVNDIPDLSIYALGSANNGGGTDGEEFTFPADTASAGDFLYVASESIQFTAFFGFAPDYTSGAMGINGDDAVELFTNGSVSDIFGDINVDGSGQPWEYTDGWAYRNDETGPDGSTFVLSNWSFSGPNALDGETTNDSAATPVPIGTYTVAAVASFSISKSAPVLVAPSSLFTYTIAVTNSTGITTTGTVITDVVPGNATFATASDGGVEAGGIVSWTITGDFVDGTSIQRTFVVTATSSNGINIVNDEYSVMATEWMTMAYGSPVTSTVSPLDLSITKVGPVYGVISDTLVYAITLSNQGVANADNVIITDTAPISTTIIASDMGMAVKPVPGVYVWNLGTILSDTVETYYITATVGSDVASGTVLTNTIAATTSTIGDDLSNNADQWETTVYPYVSIYDIQYTVDSSGDSPYEDETVATEGIVTAVFGKYVFIQDGAGAWNGIHLEKSGNTLAMGDHIRLIGQIEEFYGLTRFHSNTEITVLSSGNALPAFVDDVASNDISVEMYESVLVQVNNATVTNDDAGYGEWTVSDGSGDVLLDDYGKASYTYTPVNDDHLVYVRGPLTYAYGDFKIEPRNDSDFALGLLIAKDAPGLVAPGELFTYTITVDNQTDTELLGLVITDVVPDNTAFAYALDSGVETGGVVSWSVASLAHESTASVSFVVTATDHIATAVNDDYAVSADNHDSVAGDRIITHINDGLRIYHVQGEDFVSPMLGQTVTVPGIVVADFQTPAGMDGFYIQDAAGDNNPLTSDGIFVYHSATDVSLGELVTVTGRVAEYNQATQLTNVSAITHVASSELITPTTVVLPEVVNGDLERYEGMLITIPQTMTVGQNYFLGRYGQVTLAADGHMFQPTNIYTPTSASAVALADENARRLIILDDAKSFSNPDPVPYIGQDGTLRAGDTVTGLEGVLDEGLITSYNPGPIDYRLQPTTQITFTRVNTRTATPEAVDGNISVASFNVLNYFTTLDDSGPICGPAGDEDCRGAKNQAEFDRQHTKIITAMLSIDADIVGLMEIENNATEAISNLVDGLNAIAGAGTYAYIDSGIVGDDVIKVAMIYQPSSVMPVGTTAVLTDTFPFNVNTRPPIAQAFATTLTGEEFIVVVNHFKSKGSACDSIYNPDTGTDFIDPDTGDGQANCNLTRVEAANVMDTWLDTDPTGTGSDDILIIGDLNAYAKEDPITTLTGLGYTNLSETYGGPWAYSYIFDGQLGYLDHALASSSMAAYVTGTTHWHINADEPSALDYTDYNLPYLYQPNAYRSSDHDPVVIGLSYLAKTYLPILMK